MKNGFIFLFFFSFSCAFAQNEDFSKNIKLYYNLEYTDYEQIYAERNQQILSKNGSNYSIGHLSPAFSFSKKRLFREVELSKLLIGVKDDITMNEFIGQDILETISGERKISFDIAARFELGIAAFKENDFFNPILAIGIQPYFSYGEIHPATSLPSQIYFRNSGAAIQFTPHFQIQATERLMIDLAPIVSLIDFGKFFERTNNPGWTNEEQVFTKTFFDFLPKHFGIRLGVGYKI